MKTLEPGQHWQMKDSRIEITLVGKLLVHYRQFKGSAKRATQTSIVSQPEMQKYLKKHKAVVVAG